jgi:hypothetical protein
MVIQILILSKALDAQFTLYKKGTGKKNAFGRRAPQG